MNQARYTLASDMDKIMDIRIARATRPLAEVSLQFLNKTFPSRPGVGDPRYYAYTRSTGTTEEIELYPVPNRILTVRYVYKQRVDELVNDTDALLLDVRATTIIAGATADALRTLDKYDEANRYEQVFQRELNEMVGEDAREARPTRIALAPQYVRHRRSRNVRDLDDWRPETENPYD
jgi:hypothetical protein